ncbi:MAG: serine/threonine protein phosphatase, partial [Clostridia bacterium]|nr:serine/threonine protein phosphatase [Clostridia bacterium]
MLYLISDIHGDYELFIKLLKKINFSEKDKMIVLGDMLDKGEKSIKLLEFLFGEHRNNFECIMGNHEHDLLKYYYKLLDIGKYSEEEIVRHCNDFSDIREGLTIELIKELESLPYFIEYDDFICVHASVPLDDEDVVKSLHKAEIEELVYDRRFKAPLILPNNSKCVVFGHTPTNFIRRQRKEVIPKNSYVWYDKVYRNKIGIDCGNPEQKRLCCLDLTNGIE